MMRKFSILCLLAFMALCGLTACKEDPEAFDNVPEVFVDEASDLLRTSAVLTGRILAPANAMIREYGFKVSSTSDFTSADTDVYRYSDEESLASFSQQITNLKIGHTYFYVAYAANGLEEMTSTLKTFTTPTRSGVLLSDFRLVDEATVTFSARVGDTGGGEIHGVGFCWATDDTPTTYDETVITTLNSDNAFTASLSGLEAGVTYYVRAFADSDILGDGTTQTISYSRDVLEIRLEQEPVKVLPTLDVVYLEAETTQNALWFQVHCTSRDAVESHFYFVEKVIWDAALANGASMRDVIFENGFHYYNQGAYEAYFADLNSANGILSGSSALAPGTTYAGGIYVVNREGIESEVCYLEGTTLPEERTEPASNEIWYTSTDGKIVAPYDATVFGANIVSNTYENGQGVITFDGPVTSIGEYAFYKCAGLTSVTIPDNVTSIGEGAFYDCAGLTSVNIPDSVTSIKRFAFWGCSSLTGVNIPNGITSIADQVFNDCTALTTIVIPNNVTYIGKFAFGGCNTLTSVTIGNRVRTIDNGAFARCFSLTSITIPNGVSVMGAWVFEHCTGLKSITIPDSVNSIGESAFDSCTALTAFYGRFASSDNRCLIVDGVLNSFAPVGLIEYVIPHGITSIGPTAFRNYTDLTSIAIPDSITEIGYRAFENCFGLTNITIPDSVTSIKGEAFGACTALASVYCEPTTPPIGAGSMFYGNADRKIYVPNASVEAYKSAQYWSEYADSIYPMDTVEEVPETWKIYYTSTDGNIVEPYDATGFGANIVSNTYENGQGVILFDDPVISIGGSAFEDCTGLTSVTIPDSVTSIGAQAFHNCESLTSVTIGNGVTLIEWDAFSGCQNLQNVYIFDLSAWCKIKFEITTIYWAILSNPLYYGAKLYLNGELVTNLVIPNDVTEIKQGAFIGCGSLTSVTIPDSVTSIALVAFYSCPSLTNVEIGNGVISIGAEAFYDCDSLTNVYCNPTTPPEGGSKMFEYNASGRKIYVPNASVDAYKAASGWSSYASSIVGYDF